MREVCQVVLADKAHQVMAILDKKECGEKLAPYQIYIVSDHQRENEDPQDHEDPKARKEIQVEASQDTQEPKEIEETWVLLDVMETMDGPENRDHLVTMEGAMEVLRVKEETEDLTAHQDLQALVYQVSKINSF